MKADVQKYEKSGMVFAIFGNFKTFVDVSTTKTQFMGLRFIQVALMRKNFIT